MTLEQAAETLSAANSFFDLGRMSPKDFGSALTDAATRIQALEARLEMPKPAPSTPPPAA